MRRCVVLLHLNADYTGHLADFWNQRRSPGLPVYIFFALEVFRAFRARADVKSLLFSEHFAEGVQDLLGQNTAILLSGDGFVGGRYQNALPTLAVFSYRPADALTRHVIRFYVAARLDSLSPAQRGDYEILSIYSPAHCCGKTTFALPLGLTHAAQGRTLLLSLEDYTGAYAQIAPDVAENPLEPLFTHSSDRYSWAVLQNRLFTFGALDLLPSVRCVGDLSLLPPEEFATLLQHIARESGYRSVMLDFGAFDHHAFELLEPRDRIFMSVLSGPLSALELNSFREYLRQSGRVQLLKRIETPELPPETEKAQDYACALLPAYESGSLYELVAVLH